MSLPSWWCVLIGRDGAPTAVVPIRRRPPPTPASAHTTPAVSHRRAGECWFSVDPDTLRLLNGLDRAGRVAAGWSPVLAEITASLATAQPGPPNGDPAARLPSAALRRWVHIRDRRCTFPGCRAPAHRTDVDHIVEHARGGATVDTGLAPACRHDHMLRHKGGWSVAQASPGHVVWTSPLGRSYQRLPPLELRDLPNPRSGALREDDVDLELERERNKNSCPGGDPPSCLEPDPEPEPPPPPPGPQSTPDEEIPF
jgi:hypothetical protein